VIAKHQKKMGPIILSVESGDLMEAWEETIRSTVEDYNTKDNQEFCVNETWVKDPPNTLFFNLNRVQYDSTRMEVVKDLRKFEFKPTICVDEHLEGNIGRISGIQKNTKRLKDEIK
jgi:hypothetical protein